MWDTNLQRRVYIAIFGWIAIAHWYTTLRHLSYMISWPSYSVASVNVLMQTMSSETTKCGGSEWQRKNEERKKKKKKRGKLTNVVYTTNQSISTRIPSVSIYHRRKLPQHINPNTQYPTKRKFPLLFPILSRTVLVT